MPCRGLGFSLWPQCSEEPWAQAAVYQIGESENSNSSRAGRKLYYHVFNIPNEFDIRYMVNFIFIQQCGAWSFRNSLSFA